MKRTLILLLTAVMVFSAFAGCAKTDPPTTTAPTTQATTAPTEATTVPTTAPVETTLPYDEEYAQMMQQIADSFQYGTDYLQSGGGALDDFGMSTPAQDPKGSKFKVGYAKVDITPDAKWKLPLIGNNDHKTRVATGTLERLWANCTAMTDEKGTTVILFGVDTHSISKPLIDGVRAGITKATGIKAKYIQMTASHTHQGPPMSQDGYGYSDGAKYLNATIDKCVKAAAAALADRKSAVMSTAITRVPGVNHVRYYLLEDGTLLGNARQSDMAKYYHQAQNSDDLLQIVKFTRDGGKDVALVNWQAHYRGHDKKDYTKYGSDYMGVLRQQLLTRANCESVFLLGASGNLVSASSMHQLNTSAATDYETVGKALANAAVSAMQNMTPAKTGKITLESKNFHISTNRYDYELYTFGIGDVGFAMMPCEPFQSLGMNIRDNSPYKMTLIGTCANDTGWNGYIPDTQAYSAVNPYGVSKNYVRGDETKFEKQYLTMLKKCFKNGTTKQVPKESGYVTDNAPMEDVLTYTGTGKAPVAVKNGLYQVWLRSGSSTTMFLAEGKDLAARLANGTDMRILLDGRRVVVAVR